MEYGCLSVSYSLSFSALLSYIIVPYLSCKIGLEVQIDKMRGYGSRKDKKKEIMVFLDLSCKEK